MERMRNEDHIGSVATVEMDIELYKKKPDFLWTKRTNQGQI